MIKPSSSWTRISYKEFEAFVLANQKDLNITGYEIKEMVYITEDRTRGEKGKETETGECEVRVLFTYYKYPSVSEKSVMAAGHVDTKRELLVYLFRFQRRDFQVIHLKPNRLSCRSGIFLTRSLPLHSCFLSHPSS